MYPTLTPVIHELLCQSIDHPNFLSVKWGATRQLRNPAALIGCSLLHIPGQSVGGRAHLVPSRPSHTMSLTGSLRGVTGAVGRHAAVTQQVQLPAIAYMRRSFAVAQLRQQHQQIRSATSSANVPTTTLSQKEAMDLLNKQRSMRPNSPHLTIYQPQLTWYGSIANRITGVGLSGRAYCPEGQLGRHVLTSALLSLQCSMSGQSPTWPCLTRPLAKCSRRRIWSTTLPWLPTGSS